MISSDCSTSENPGHREITLRARIRAKSIQKPAHGHRASARRASQLICDRPTAIFIAIRESSKSPFRSRGSLYRLANGPKPPPRSSGFRKLRRIGDDHRFECPLERKVGKFGKAANKGERSQSGGGWNRFSRLPAMGGYAISRRMKTPARSPMILRAFLAFGRRRGAGGGGEKERDVERRKIFSRNVLAIGLCLAVPLYSAFNPASDLRGRSSILRVHLPPSRRDATRSGAGPPLRISIASGTLSHIFSSGRARKL